MKNSKFLIPRTFVFIFFASTIIFASCKGQPKTNGDARDFKMNCVILTRAQVQAWVDSGWTRPSDPTRIQSLLFQFYSPEGEDAANNMTLLTYPGRNWEDVKINGRTALQIDTACVPLKLAGKTVLANNVVNLKDLKIIKADGSLADFDYVRFRPIKTHGEYLSFAFDVVKLVNNQETVLESDDTNPCPPYCPEPPIDTTQRGY